MLLISVVTCAAPYIVHGDASSQIITYQTEVTYHCDHGYQFPPNAPISGICQESGQLEPVPTGCIGIKILIYFIYFVKYIIYLSKVLHQSQYNWDKVTLVTRWILHTMLTICWAVSQIAVSFFHFCQSCPKLPEESEASWTPNAMHRYRNFGSELPVTPNKQLFWGWA